MTNDIKKLFSSFKQTTLLPHERASMREETKLFMAEHPAVAPLVIRMWERFATPAYSFRYHPAAFAFALVLCVGVGTSYAAEGALPGDTLYPVKIHVNESVQGALAVSDESKARWNAARVVRRLEEAEVLAAEGRLSASASADIDSELQNSGKEFDDSVEAIAQNEDGATALVDVQSNFEAALDAHVEVLSALAVTLPSSQRTISPILATAEARARGIKHARAQAERAIVFSDTEEVRTAASVKKDEAKEALKTARAISLKASSTLGAVSAQGASTSAFHAEQAVHAGERHYEKGEYVKALRTFQAAIRTAAETKVNVDVRESLQSQVTLPAFKAATAASTTIETDVETDEDTSAAGL